MYLDKIQDSNLLNINLGIIKVDALYAGKLLHVNLLGLDISVGLSKKSTDNKQDTDLAIITIGDSSIKLPCNENGLLNDNDAKSNISVSLIKANRTKITDSNVYGISYGYDVYAGGAGNDKDGSAEDGRSGGFVGFNDEGLLKNNNIYYCDVVRGTNDLVGPFSGISKLDSQYKFNTLEKVEGEDNNYRIYRKLDQSLDQIEKNNSILNSSHKKDDASGWDIYTIGHMNPVKTFETLKNAVLASKSDSVKADLNAYESPAKAVLMSDTKTTLNTGDSDTPEPSESQDPCDENIKLTINKVWKDLNNFDNSRPTVNIGDVVTYYVKGSIPDTTGYDQYQYIIHDELSTGLDFVNDATGTALGEGATTVNVTVAFTDNTLTAAGTKPTTATLDTANNRKMSLDLSEWVRDNQANKGKEFTVTYYAKVNKDAVVTEKNNAQLEYGNKPGETTKTTPSEAKTPTYPLDILKKKAGTGTGEVALEKLAGAKFKLYKDSVDEANVIKISETAVNGNYVVDSTSTTTEFVSVENIEGKDYNLHVNGLAEGTYYLVETKAPDGFNKLTAPVKITITKSADADATKWTISKDGDDETDKIIDIANSTGSLLPSTGGRGAIAFAVIAALLVFGVAVSFIRDKRKEA